MPTALTPQTTATAPAPPPSGYAVTGIDVASYQGTVDWTAVARAGTSFALVKATEGTTYTNPYYAAQYSGALAAGLEVGSYAFARPDANNPVDQAKYLVGQSQPMTAGRTLPFMLDMEAPYSGTGVSNKCWNLTPALMTAWIRAYVDEVRTLTGMPMLIYTNPDWWNVCTANSAAFSDQLLDIAYWSSAAPTTVPASWSQWTFWQYADAGTLPGDQDVFYGTRAQLTAITYSAFPDVPPSSPFAADIAWLVTQGIAGGYPDGGYHPTDPVTRQAMAAFMYRYANPAATAPPCTSAAFPDVPATSPYCAEIEWLVVHGIASGYRDGSFQPTAPVSRQAMAAFMFRLTGTGVAGQCATAPFNDVSAANPFCGYIEWLVTNNIASGYSDGGFHPAAAVSRQAMAAFLHRLFEVTNPA